MQLLKKTVDKIINSLGYNITKIREQEPDNPFNILRIVLDDYIKHNHQFFFIQIGANDGVRWDPLREFILRNNTPGLLVEPLPDFFTQLKFNYTNQNNLSFCQAAISEHNGEQKLYRVKSDAPVKDGIHGVASFDIQHVLIFVPQKYIETVSVPTITPETLIKKYNVGHVELLQIDTEGYDFEVLKMFLEIPGFKPRIINFENIHLTVTDKLNAKKLLIKHGYYFLDVGIDTVAIHETYPNKVILEQK